MSSFSFNPLEIFGFADLLRAKLPWQWQWQPVFTTWLILSIGSAILAVLFLALHFSQREKPKINWTFEKTGYPVTLDMMVAPAIM